MECVNGKHSRRSRVGKHWGIGMFSFKCPVGSGFLNCGCCVHLELGVEWTERGCKRGWKSGRTGLAVLEFSCSFYIEFVKLWDGMKNCVCGNIVRIHAWRIISVWWHGGGSKIRDRYVRRVAFEIGWLRDPIWRLIVR